MPDSNTWVPVTNSTDKGFDTTWSVNCNCSFHTNGVLGTIMDIPDDRWTTDEINHNNAGQKNEARSMKETGRDPLPRPRDRATRPTRGIRGQKAQQEHSRAPAKTPP